MAFAYRLEHEDGTPATRHAKDSRAGLARR
jgi:hypothetical protein